MNKGAFRLTAALAFLFVSCGKNGLYPVSGKVTYKGTPAVGAVVFFQRPGVDPLNEHLIMGIVQPDGSFELVCGSLGTGAPPGEYDVLIEWKQGTGQGKGRRQHDPDQLKGRYADPKHPLIHVSIKPQPNLLAPFEFME